MNAEQKTPQDPDRFAMKSKEHLKAWLEATGREFVILHAADLVDSVPWPEGVETVVHLIQGYGQHRQFSRPTGLSTRAEKGNALSKLIPIARGDHLELDEIAACRAQLDRMEDALMEERAGAVPTPPEDK